jgi:hypothetical protein
VPVKAKAQIKLIVRRPDIAPYPVALYNIFCSQVSARIDLAQSPPLAATAIEAQSRRVGLIKDTGG